MIKIDYEGAWKEMKEDMGFTSPKDLYQTIVLHMEKLEKKHTQPIENTITMRLECNNFNAIDKKNIEDYFNWLATNNINFKIKEMK